MRFEWKNFVRKVRKDQTKIKLHVFSFLNRHDLISANQVSQAQYAVLNHSKTSPQDGSVVNYQSLTGMHKILGAESNEVEIKAAKDNRLLLKYIYYNYHSYFTYDDNFSMHLVHSRSKRIFSVYDWRTDQYTHFDDELWMKEVIELANGNFATISFKEWPPNDKKRENYAIRIWDGINKTLVGEIPFSEQPLAMAQISATQLASISCKREICIWDLTTYSLLKQLQLTREKIDSAIICGVEGKLCIQTEKFSTNTRTLHFVSWDSNLNNIMMIESPFYLIAEKLFLFTRNTSLIKTSDNCFVLGYGTLIRIYNLDGTLIRAFEPATSSIKSLLELPGGKIAFSERGNKIKIIDKETGALLARVKLDVDNKPNHTDIGVDKLIACDDNGNIMFRNLATNRELFLLKFAPLHHILQLNEQEERETIVPTFKPRS